MTRRDFLNSVALSLAGPAGVWLFRAHAGRPLRLLVLDALDQIGGAAHGSAFVPWSGRRRVG